MLWLLPPQAFTFINNPHLVEAVTSIGVGTVTREQLAEKWVPALAAEAAGATAAILNVPESKHTVLRVWEQVGDDMPELRDVAVLILSAHAISAATERNW